MNKTAIAFSTKDRVELSKQSVEPLLQPDKFHLFWADGSQTSVGQEFFDKWRRLTANARTNIIGGADAAIVFSLTTMLNHPNNYDYVGLVENDVLLDPDWFEATMALFEKGRQDGLEVGAVSARCYEDRILVQRDGYAVMHNLGAGQVIFTRQAARLVLENFRTGWTVENRRTFMQVSGLDIAHWAPFVQQPHVTCADWQFDRVLAQHGLVSLALTPAKCQMIGQEPSLEEQGLVLAKGPVEERRDAAAFEQLIARTALIREGAMQLPDTRFMQNDDGSFVIMPHQVSMLGGGFEGDWRLKWNQGIGPFSWEAGRLEEYDMGHGNVGEQEPIMTCPISGPCSLLMQGGQGGGKIMASDEQTGWEITADVKPGPDIFNLQVPGNIGYRNVRLTALTPGIVFVGIVCREMQPYLPEVQFDHSMLPNT